MIVECPEELLFTIEQKLVDELKPEYNIAIENVAVPIGLPYKDKTLYKKYAEERLKNDVNFGWKSKAIIKLDSVGKALKKGTKCKGFYLKYKTVD